MEKSKSYTFGLILEPVRNVNVSLDYYHIRIDNQIISAINDPAYDATPFLVRGVPIAQPFVNEDGSLSTVTPPVGNALFAPYPYENALYTMTNGIDLDARVNWPLAGGKLSAQLTATHMISYKQGTVGADAIQLAGTHGPSANAGDTGNPRDRAQLKFGWHKGPLSVSTTVTWVSSFDVTDPSSANAVTCADAISFVFATPNPEFCRVRAFTSVDVYGEYRLTKQLSLHASVLNLFNKPPPLDFQTYGSSPSTFYNPALHQAGPSDALSMSGSTTNSEQLDMRLKRHSLLETGQSNTRCIMKPRSGVGHFYTRARRSCPRNFFAHGFNLLCSRPNICLLLSIYLGGDYA